MKTTQKNKVQASEYAAPDLTVKALITDSVFFASEGQIGAPEYDIGQDTTDF